MRVLVLMALMALLGGSALAVEPIAGTGVGTGTCAEFAQDYKNNPKLAERIYGAWAEGFMAGLNFATPSDELFGRDLAATVERQTFHIRQYCDAHPLAVFIQAVLDFYGTLPKHQN
jgi:hypothetical protein